VCVTFGLPSRSPLSSQRGDTTGTARLSRRVARCTVELSSSRRRKKRTAGLPERVLLLTRKPHLGLIYRGLPVRRNPSSGMPRPSLIQPRQIVAKSVGPPPRAEGRRWSRRAKARAMASYFLNQGPPRDFGRVPPSDQFDIQRSDLINGYGCVLCPAASRRCFFFFSLQQTSPCNAFFRTTKTARSSRRLGGYDGYCRQYCPGQKLVETHGRPQQLIIRKIVQRLDSSASCAA